MPDGLICMLACYFTWYLRKVITDVAESRGGVWLAPPLLSCAEFRIEKIDRHGTNVRLIGIGELVTTSCLAWM